VKNSQEFKNVGMEGTWFSRANCQIGILLRLPFLLLCWHSSFCYQNWRHPKRNSMIRMERLLTKIDKALQRDFYMFRKAPQVITMTTYCWYIVPTIVPKVTNWSSIEWIHQCNKEWRAPKNGSWKENITTTVLHQPQLLCHWNHKTL